MADDSIETRPQRRWMPAAAALAVVGAVLLAGVAGGLGTSDSGDGASRSNAPGRDASAHGDPVATVSVSPEPQRRKSRLAQPLALGTAGRDVERLQDRLTELGFDPGPVDGQFGELTQAAVWAYEKLIAGTPRAEASGVVTPAMWKAMQDNISIEPRRPESTPNHTEIYLPEQVVVFFRDNEPALVSHMSSGDDEEWCEEVTISPGEYGNEDGDEPLVRGECGISYTPPGVFTYDRQVEGKRESALGGMWNPMYFNYGIAIHGAMNVPLEPASHGCIRLPLPVSERIQELASLGDQVFVFDGIQEPEDVSEHDALPVFNWRDPDWTPPTTLPPATPPPPPPVETAPAPASSPAPTTSAPAPVTTPPATGTQPPETAPTSTPPTGTEPGPTTSDPATTVARTTQPPPGSTVPEPEGNMLSDGMDVLPGT